MDHYDSVVENIILIYMDFFFEWLPCGFIGQACCYQSICYLQEQLRQHKEMNYVLKNIIQDFREHFLIAYAQKNR